MATKAIHTIKASYDRGETYPHGNEEVEQEDLAEARLTTLPGEMIFEVINDR